MTTMVDVASLRRGSNCLHTFLKKPLRGAVEEMAFTVISPRGVSDLSPRQQKKDLLFRKDRKPGNLQCVPKFTESKVNNSTWSGV